MSNDDFLDQVIAHSEEIAAAARQKKREQSANDRVRARDLLSLRQAAYVAEFDKETIRRACLRTRDSKDALGFWFEERWFVYKTALLDWIERRRKHGKSSRRIAEDRLRDLS